jgi:hypothetical protein
MAKRLLDVDAFTGIRTYHEYDAAEDRTTISYEGDAEPVIENNKRLQNEATGRMGDFCHVASIPPTIQLKWLIEKGVDVLNPDHADGVKRLLNDPEWRYLKVRNIIL